MAARSSGGSKIVRTLALIAATVGLATCSTAPEHLATSSKAPACRSAENREAERESTAPICPASEAGPTKACRGAADCGGSQCLVASYPRQVNGICAQWAPAGCYHTINSGEETEIQVCISH
jgi:hypothetical protein